MYTEHWQETDRCGSYTDESTIVAEAGDVECSLCDTIVEQDNAIECDICHEKHCKHCTTPNNHGTGLNVCDTCNENGKFIEHLVGQIYKLTYDKTEYRKTLKHLVKIFGCADVLTVSDLGRLEGYTKTVLEIVK